MLVSNIPNVLRAFWKTRSDNVACFIGTPGMGKTDLVNQHVQWIRENTEFKNSKMVLITLSQSLPTEVSGITMPNRESETMEIYDHVRLASLNDGDVLFLDELLQAPASVLSACLTLIQSRVMNSGHKLPDIQIVAASNYVHPRSIHPAVLQRFMFFDVQFDASQWIEYMQSRYPELRRLPSDEMLKFAKCAVYDDVEVGSKWNISSPRTAEKLYMAYRGADENDLDAIHSIYDSNDLSGTSIIDLCKEIERIRYMVGQNDKYLEDAKVMKTKILAAWDLMNAFFNVNTSDIVLLYDDVVVENAHVTMQRFAIFNEEILCGSHKQHSISASNIDKYLAITFIKAVKAFKDVGLDTCVEYVKGITETINGELLKDIPMDVFAVLNDVNLYSFAINDELYEIANVDNRHVKALIEIKAKQDEMQKLIETKTKAAEEEAAAELDNVQKAMEEAEAEAAKEDEEPQATEEESQITEDEDDK